VDDQDADTDPWSAMADEWHRRWGRFAEPAWTVVLDAVAVRPGQRALDVGCGPGDLLAHLAGLGVRVAGIDPARGMIAVARALAPAADVRHGEAADLPWDDDSFDLAIAINALHLADEAAPALAEMSRVVVPGGHVAIVTWAEARHNDVDVIARAVAADDGDEPEADGDEREDVADALDRLLAEAGLAAVSSGLVEAPWEAADDDALVRGVLLGEDPGTLAERSPVVVTAAAPFRLDDGSYRLRNHLRYAIGCVGVRSR
jgi:ubiquinone/menaquinone biosynthesis C-methylase UbiE